TKMPRTNHYFLSILLLAVSIVAGADKITPPPELAPFFTPPREYQNDFGQYHSPLIFSDGSHVQNAADWSRRRREILTTWQNIMGRWPALIEKPRVEIVSTTRRDNIIQQ